MEQQGRGRKSPVAHDMPRRLVGSKCLDQRVPVYWDQTVPVWPFANSPAATKLSARNADAATETSNLRHCCCTNSSRTPQCTTTFSFQLVPSASPAGAMIFEEQSARASNSAVCSSSSSSSSNNNDNVFDPPAPTSTSDLHQVLKKLTPLPASESYRLLPPRVEMGGAAGGSVSRIKLTRVLQIVLPLCKRPQELPNDVGTLSWEVDRSCVRPGLHSTQSCHYTKVRSWSDGGAHGQAG